MRDHIRIPIKTIAVPLPGITPMPKQTETAGRSLFPKEPLPPRVMSLGQRLRTDPSELVGWSLFFLLGPGFLLSLLGAFIYQNAYMDLTWPKYIVGYILAAAVCALPVMLIANSIANEEAQTKIRKQKNEDDARAKKEAEAQAKREYAEQIESRQNAHLRSTIRLSLLEWAVQHDAVDKIDDLASTLTSKVIDHYREPVSPEVKG